MYSCPKVLWDHLLPQKKQESTPGQLLGFQKEHPGLSWGLRGGEMSGKGKVHEGLTLHAALNAG